MRPYVLSILLLVVVAFSFATALEPWHQSWEGGRTQADNLLEVALGDSRELLARHFFAKADSYFHNGFAPTIFDKTEGVETGHMAGNASEEEGEHNLLGKPRDWIDGFSRNFYPSRHSHLGEGKCDKCDHHGTGDEHAEHRAHDEAQGADEREILPWLKLSLQLDPKRVETYVVAAYWLKNSLKKVDAAERLLREGLQNVPGNPEILFELGRIQLDDRHDVGRARNLWELALKKWNERERDRENPNLFILSQILGNLAILEENAGRPNEAIQHLRRLQTFSPNKASIAKWIETLQTPHQQPN
jgi:tetratricopeptide (TPR) repeat protein